MEIYIITRSRVRLFDGYYGENNEKLYRKKEEFFETKEKAFVSYIKAAKYIRELLENENEHYGNIFEEKDMKKWDVFFIGFHHECKLFYKDDPIVEHVCKSKNIPCDRTYVEYKIKTINLDFEVLDETQEILKGLA